LVGYQWLPMVGWLSLGLPIVNVLSYQDFSLNFGAEEIKEIVKGMA